MLTDTLTRECVSLSKFNLTYPVPKAINMTKTILIPLAPGCEELEAVTLIDLFRRAKLNVVTAGLNDGPITASRGTRLLADVALDEVMGRAFDLVALPGGLPGADLLKADPRIREILARTVQRGAYIAAICAAPRVLAHAGLLKGKRITCFPGSLSSHELNDVTLSTDGVVQDGLVITSKGPGTAMDFALYLIELLTNRATRDNVESGLQRTA